MRKPIAVSVLILVVGLAMALPVRSTSRVLVTAPESGEVYDVTPFSGDEVRVPESAYYTIIPTLPVGPLAAVQAMGHQIEGLAAHNDGTCPHPVGEGCCIWRWRKACFDFDQPEIIWDHEYSVNC